MFLSKLSNGYYHLYYFQENGKKTKVSTGTKCKKDAQKFLNSFCKQLYQKTTTHTDLITEIQNHLTSTKSKTVKDDSSEILLKNFAFEFLKNAEPTHTDKTMKGYKSAFKSFINFTGDIPLSKIDNKLMHRFFAEKLSNSIHQARKHRIVLGYAFNWAVKNEYLKSNPCDCIPRYKLPEKQPLYYSYTDYDNLIKVIDNKDIKDLAIVAVNTGLRQMELLTMVWSQIDFEHRYIILDNRQHLTKSKKVRTIPLNTHAIEVLKSRYETYKDITDNVFTYQGKLIKQDLFSHHFKKYVLAANLNPKLNFHSLRHTFATWLIKKGAPIYEVSKLLGHSDIKTTEIYSHINPEDLRGSIDLLN